MNLASIIERHPDDAVAIISRGKSTTFRELREQVAGFRGGLVGLGLEPGDRVGIVCGNNWYFVVSYLAILGAGLVAVPLNPQSPGPEMATQLRLTGCRAVVVGPAGRSSFSAIDLGGLPGLQVVIACRGGDLSDAVLLDDLVASEPHPLVERADDDLAVLMFTSGTAGSPRAAMLGHGNLRANLEQVQAHPGRSQASTDITFGLLPLFHIFGLNVVLGLSLHQGSTVLMVERFDPQSALDSIERHEVSIVTGPPTMWSAWLGLPDADAGAFRSVRIAASGAAKLPLEVARAVEERFGLHLAEGYGLTEASPVVTSSLGTGAPFGSIGAPLPGVHMRLVDPDGDDVLIGDAGEIWLRGPNVFQGYWDDPEATAATIDRDGWLHTGDVAVVDDDGNVFLVDRAKDLIIVSGFNVYPAEVEDVLVEHPAVVAVAVVGVPHPHTGEAVKAYVVLDDDLAVEEDDLIEHVAARLARYKCPRKIMFVDELPQGLGGKVLRRNLR